MTAPRISVCIPTWNGARDLARLLPRLREQTVDGGLEVVAIDSSSTDATRDLLAKHATRFETIAQRDFGHGRTRNALARLARGERLVFLSQDALPRDPTTIATLAAALDDPRTAGAWGRLLPHDDDDALTKRTALDAPEASEHAFTVEPIDSAEFDARERSDRARLNNVASCLRAKVLRALPFPDVAFGEDSAWAALALSAGHRLRFEPRAVFLHAHRYTPSAAYERHRVDAEFQRTTHGVLARPTLRSVVKGFAHELRADWRFVRAHGGWTSLARAPLLRGAQVLGAWRGSRE